MPFQYAKASGLYDEAQSFMSGVATVFKDAGSIPATLDSYDDAVDGSYLKAAGGMYYQKTADAGREPAVATTI